MHLSRREFLVGVSAAATQACTPIPDARCSLTATPSCAAPDPLPGVGLVAQRCELFAFDEVHRATPTVYHPRSAGDLQALFKAVPCGRRVTIRGGGQAIDSQSLNRDLVFVIDDPSFRNIGEPQHDDDGFYITTGAGASWTCVVAKVSCYGLMPPSVVTAPDATVGGTLSSDCLSRMSPVVGKEGDQIRSFSIVLANGDLAFCKRNDPDPDKNALFNAVIGGFGYLGAVTEVSFDLGVVRSHPGELGARPCVFTRSTRHGPATDLDVVLRSLQSRSFQAHKNWKEHPERHKGARTSSVPETLARAPEWSALSIASFLTGSGMSANLLEQRYIDAEALDPFPSGIYQMKSSFPSVAEIDSATFPTTVEIGLDFCPEGEFVDELFGWTFFLGNSAVPAKAAAHAKGNRLNFTQQSFALPAGTKWAVDTRPTRRFLELLEARLHAADIRPEDIDFLYIPEDQFLMSASRGLTSFVVTVSFAETNRKSVFSAELVDTLHVLSNDCRVLGGRVHLVKGVYADASDLKAMYGDAAAEFLKLKNKYDPRNVLRNEFFERVFIA